MKFKKIEEDELHGSEALLQHLKDTKRPSDVTGPECPICKGWGKIFHHGERETCPKCKGTGVIKEQTLAGAGFPTATAGGEQAIDKMPLGRKLAKRKKKVKTIMVKRALPKL